MTMNSTPLSHEETTVTSQQLLERAQILYEFVDLFSQYESTPRNYGWTENLTMNEVHLLAKIDSEPGICSVDLVEVFHRSKGYISRITKKLEAGGYIIRVADKQDAKRQLLFLTPSGKKLCTAHADFDERTLIKTYQYLRRDCTPEEIEAFHKVMQVYINIMNAASRKHRDAKKRRGGKTPAGSE